MVDISGIDTPAVSIFRNRTFRQQIADLGQEILFARRRLASGCVFHQASTPGPAADRVFSSSARFSFGAKLPDQTGEAAPKPFGLDTGPGQGLSRHDEIIEAIVDHEAVAFSHLVSKNPAESRGSSAGSRAQRRQRGQMAFKGCPRFAAMRAATYPARRCFSAASFFFSRALGGELEGAGTPRGVIVDLRR